MRNNRVLIIVLLSAIAFSRTLAQNEEEKKKTYFSNISIDPAGHVCYRESLDKNDMNRIEYTADGKSTLELFYTSASAQTNVQAIDFDSDGRIDLIYVMKEKRTGGKDLIRTSDFYRGPGYLEHLKRHLGHALLTGRHPLIKDRPEELKRSEEIEATLEALNKRTIGNEDIGVYSSEKQFEESSSKEIKEAFAASDTLNAAIRNILAGDFRILSKSPEIATKYSVEIRDLLEIEPPLGAPAKK